MIVEIFGLPGSGKSVLAKDITHRTGLSIVRLGLFNRLRWWMIALFRSPRTTVYGVRFLLRHAERSLYSLFMNGCVDRYAKWEKARSDGGIVDEGPLQNALSFPCRELTEVEVVNVVREVPRSDIVVLVSASRDERKKRQEERGRVARDGEWEAYAEKNALHIEEELIRAGRNIVRFPEESLEAVVSAIQTKP